MIKQLTLFGYFTSEVGGTQVLRHILGRYDGTLAYKPGDRAWVHGSKALKDESLDLWQTIAKKKQWFRRFLS